MEQRVSVHQLAKSSDPALLDAQSKAIKKIRLKSLLNDPQGFISKYSDELDQPKDFWINRLQQSHVHHFVAIADEREGLALSEKHWVAILVVADMGAYRSDAKYSSALSPALYIMNALWVDPAVRGRGVGRRIVEFASAWSENHSRENGFIGSIFELEALIDNTSAIQFYTKIGFVPIEDKQGREKDGVPVRMVRMRYLTSNA